MKQRYQAQQRTSSSSAVKVPQPLAVKMEQLLSTNRGRAHSVDAPRNDIRGMNIHQFRISTLLHVVVQLDPSVWLSIGMVTFGVCLKSRKDGAPYVQVDSGPSVT